MSEDRFNLSPHDVGILKGAASSRQDAPKTPQAAWGNFLRFLLEPGSMYSFDRLPRTPRRFLFVAETKSLPGRDLPSEGAALGRALMVAWFELAEQAMQGAIVSPVAGGQDGLQLMPCTIAEISLTAGFHPTIPTNASEREVELIHERAFLGHGVLRYDCERIGDSESAWRFVLRNPVDVEEHISASRPLEDMTKMALARALQLQDGLTDAERDAAWGRLKKGELLLALQGARLPEAEERPARQRRVEKAPQQPQEAPQPQARQRLRVMRRPSAAQASTQSEA